MFITVACVLHLIKLQGAAYVHARIHRSKKIDQSEIGLLLESNKMRGVTKFKLKPKTAIKLSSHIKKLPLSHRIIACVIFYS